MLRERRSWLHPAHPSSFTTQRFRTTLLWTREINNSDRTEFCVEIHGIFPWKHVFGGNGVMSVTKFLPLSLWNLPPVPRRPVPRRPVVGQFSVLCHVSPIAHPSAFQMGGIFNRTSFLIYLGWVGFQIEHGRFWVLVRYSCAIRHARTWKNKLWSVRELWVMHFEVVSRSGTAIFHQHEFEGFLEIIRS